MFGNEFKTLDPPDQLEPDFRAPFDEWKATPGPKANAKFLKTLQPTIDKGIRTFVGEPNPLLTSRARMITLKSLGNYDRSRARLQTHIFNGLQGLKRIAREQSSPIHVPERILFDRANLDQYTQELTDELGREPTDQELSDRTGFSSRRISKVRSYKPGVAEGRLEQIDPSLAQAVGFTDQSAQDAWVAIVYDDLPPIDKKILEWTIGMNGHPVLSNLEIAKALGRSPGAISQRKARIQQMLNQEQDLSPFIG
jgi:DNA-directed RNA polymerase specialized sigma subunit